MHLLINNLEVQSQRIHYPPHEALESTCQLLSIPFRHDRKSGVFAVHPPLLGKCILIESLKVPGQSELALHAQLAAELRLLERLLWICGADVLLRESAYQGSHPERSHGPAYSGRWDMGLLVFPGHAVPNRIEPLAIYPWWQWGRASHRLAGCLWENDASFGGGFIRLASLRVAGHLKNRFLDVLSNVGAPTVLLSVPMVDGYMDQFIDSLSLIICQGILRYFRKPLLSPVSREIVKRASLQTAVPATVARPAAAMPQVAAVPPATAVPEVRESHASAEQSQDALAEPQQDTGHETASVTAESGLAAQNFVARAPDDQETLGAREIHEPAPTAPAIPLRDRPDPEQIRTQRTRQQQFGTQQLRAQGPRAQQSAAGICDHLPQPPRGRGTADGRPQVPSSSQPISGTAEPGAPRVSPGTDSAYTGAFMRIPRAQRDDEQLEKLRRMLLESPEESARQATEVLSKKGIQPTPEKIEEYLRYLRRMLLQSDE